MSGLVLLCQNVKKTGGDTVHYTEVILQITPGTFICTFIYILQKEYKIKLGLQLTLHLTNQMSRFVRPKPKDNKFTIT